MKVVDPFERLSAPEMAASSVRIYSRSEALRMLLRGEVTRIGKVPGASCGTRVSVVENACRGAYDR